MRRPRSVDDGVWNVDKVEEAHADSVQWGLVGARTYKGFPKTQNQLPAGVYGVSIDRNDDKAIFFRKEIHTDDILKLEASVTESVIEEIQTFWSKEKIFKDLGFLHRRGYLFYGPQGTGKSSVVRQIMSDVVKRDGLVFICDNPKFFNQGLMTVRQAEPKRPIVCVFEDIDAIIMRYGEDELLGVLDGANMIDHVLNIATTNYPERLDRRIVSRPRRFDRVLKIGLPTTEMRREFLNAQLPRLKPAKIEDLVQKTSALSMAGLTEMIISVYCLGNTLEHTLEILTAMQEGSPTSDEFGKKGKFGFAGDFGRDEAEDDDD